MRPMQVIRKYCLWCCNGQSREVLLCPSTDCSLYNYRLGKRENPDNTTACKAIRGRCVDCIGKVTTKSCKFTECLIYAFRQGKNPNRIKLRNTGFRSKKAK
jgi:hypothetical protein